MGEFFEPATTEEYVEAFLSSRSEISDKQLEVLRAQYAAPDKTVTASELADAVGYDHFLPANSLYGSIGHLLADELGRKPKRQTEQFKHWWSVLSTGESGRDGFEWTMRLQVAEALEKLGLVEPDNQSVSKASTREYDSLYGKAERKISDELGPDTPDVQAYCDAFLGVRDQLSENHLQLLKAHCSAPEHTVEPAKLAERVGYKNKSAVNLQYGLLAKQVCETLKLQLRFHIQALIKYAHPTSQHPSPQWIMRPEVVWALRELGWVSQSKEVSREEVSDQPLPEEVSETKTRSLREGAVREVKANAYERSSSARRICIEHYGYQCYVCNFDFEERYGGAGQDFIQVHHEEPLAKAGQEKEVDPIEDLKPVCPNCHAIIHRKNPPYTIEEVQAMLRE